jgi:hypothetical protein
MKGVSRKINGITGNFDSVYFERDAYLKEH